MIFQQNSCLNLYSCWKLERYCIQDSYRTSNAFLIGNFREMKWSVKIDILNWIMLHTHSILNWRAIGNKTFTGEMKVIINRTVVWTSIVVGNYRDTVYNTVIAQSTAFLNRNQWKMTWSVKIDILNWMMLHTHSSLNWRAIWNKTFTSKMKVIFNRTVVWI